MKSTVIVFTFGAVLLMLEPVFGEFVKLFDTNLFAIAYQILYKD